MGKRAAAIVAAGLAASACRSAPAPAAREERVLQVLAFTLPERVDPYSETRVGSRDVLLNVFEPLLRVDAAGRSTPELAERWDCPAEDRCAFHLRAPVFFHDGEPLRPEHVADSIRRAGAPGSALATNVADVADVRVLDGSTVLVQTRGPARLLPYTLTSIPVVKPTADGKTLVGTGPYRIRSFVPGRQVWLYRFAEYRGEAPFVEEVRFQAFADAAHALSLLRSHPRSVVLTPPRDVVRAVRDDPRFRVSSLGTGQSLYYLAFDLARDPTPGVPLGRNPYRDPRVRHAVRLALDVEAMVRDATATGGTAASQFVPPGVFGFDPDLRPAARDLRAARRLLAEAGLAGGFPTTLDVLELDRPVAELLAAQLAECGIRVAVRSHRGREFRALIDGGESTLFFYSWVVGRGSGKSMLSFLHTRDAARGLGLRNRTGYSNPRLDRVLEEATVAPEGEEHRRLLRQATGVLLEDLPWVPLFSDRITRVYTRELSFPDRLDELLMLREVQPAAASSP